MNVPRKDLRINKVERDWLLRLITEYKASRSIWTDEEEARIRDLQQRLRKLKHWPKTTAQIRAKKTMKKPAEFDRYVAGYGTTIGTNFISTWRRG